MIKSILAFALIFVGAAASADSSYVGTWCKQYDDFTHILKIDSEQKVTDLTIGNEAGEIAGMQRGYVSVGASQFNMVLNGQDAGVVDIRVHKFFGQIINLVLYYSNGSRERFKPCLFSGLAE